MARNTRLRFAGLRVAVWRWLRIPVPWLNTAASRSTGGHARSHTRLPGECRAAPAGGRRAACVCGRSPGGVHRRVRRGRVEWAPILAHAARRSLTQPQLFHCTSLPKPAWWRGAGLAVCPGGGRTPGAMGRPGGPRRVDPCRGWNEMMHSLTGSRCGAHTPSGDPLLRAPAQGSNVPRRSRVPVDRPRQPSVAVSRLPWVHFRATCDWTSRSSPEQGHVTAPPGASDPKPARAGAA